MRERLSALKAAALAAFFCIIFVPLPAGAQIYRVYRPVPAADETETTNIFSPFFEVEAGAAASLGKMRDAAGWTLSDSMQGARIRAWLRLSERWAAGVEGQRVEAFDRRTEFLKEMNKSSFSVLLKYNLTPQTTPVLYLVLGGGAVWNKAALELAFDDVDHNSALWTAGFGLDMPLGRRWKIGGEYRISYEASPWRNYVMRASSSVRHELGLQAAFLF